MKLSSSGYLPSLVLTLALAGSGCGESEPQPTVEPIGNIEPETSKASKPKKKKGSYSLVGNSFEAAEEALNNDDYERAAKILLKMQMSGNLKNNKDGWRYSSLMTELQTVLASAAADGDKKAQQVINMLRQSRGPM